MLKNTPLVLLTYPLDPHSIHPKLRDRTRIKIAKNQAHMMKHLSKADALVVLLTDIIDKKFLSRAHHLKVLGTCSTGLDHIDLPACKELGIKVINTPQVLTRATAELSLTLLLAAARRIPEGELMCRFNSFTGWKPDLLLGQKLHGKNAIVVGGGRIGRETAKLYRAIGLSVEMITREDSPRSITSKLKRAQVLSLHVSFNSSTYHWLDKRRIALLPRDCIVINTSRGQVIEEKALIQALKKKRIFAAGLDVFETEPVIPKALRNLTNVVLLPHLGSATFDTRAEMVASVTSGVWKALNGERPSNQVRF